MAAAPAVVVIGPLHADEQSLPLGPKAQSESLAQPTLADADAEAIPIAVLAAFDRSEHVAASGAPSPAVDDPVTPIDPAPMEPASCAEPFVAPQAQAQNAATWASHPAGVRSMTHETATRVPADRPVFRGSREPRCAASRSTCRHSVRFDVAMPGGHASRSGFKALCGTTRTPIPPNGILTEIPLPTFVWPEPAHARCATTKGSRSSITAGSDLGLNSLTARTLKHAL
jgi:hypothetical protein